MPETIYSETEALILAMEDYDAASGNIDRTIDYLVENFLPGELARLSSSCSLLMSACREAQRGIRAKGVDELPRMLGPPKPKVTDPDLDEDGWPKRWSDPTYLGDGPWGA